MKQERPSPWLIVSPAIQKKMPIEACPPMKQTLLENLKTQYVEIIPPTVMAPIKKYVLFAKLIENFGSFACKWLKMIGIYTRIAVTPVI